MKQNSQAKILRRRLKAFAKLLKLYPRIPADLFSDMEHNLTNWVDRLTAANTGASPVSKKAETIPEGTIQIWCDGSCAPNPGPGGWGAIIELNGKREELSGTHHDSTNNRMEMTAAIEALRQTPEGAVIQLTTDSQYLKNGITIWIEGWKRRGWRKADGKPVLNQKLWNKLDGLALNRDIIWNWVRGHSGHAENERCDELANQARLDQHR